MKQKHIRIALVAGLSLAVAGCGDRSEERYVENSSNALIETPLAQPPVEQAPPIVAPPVNVTNTATPAPPPQVTEDEQTQEDADATGMTARVARDDSANNASETAPVQ